MEVFMDERLEKALDISNYMVTLNNQTRILKEKYYENLVYYFNGATFTVSRELINFIKGLIDTDQQSVIISDDNDIPVEIENLEEFHQNILNTYFTASNEYFVEYNKMKSKRSVEGILDL
jgi:hypothetical protein